MHHQSAAAVGLRVVVGGVVRDVAMDHPLAGLECFPDDVVTLAGADVDRVGPEAGGRRQGFAVACNDLEWPAVDMHRVDEAAVGTDETYFYRLAHFHVDGVGRWRSEEHTSELQSLMRISYA